MNEENQTGKIQNLTQRGQNQAKPEDQLEGKQQIRIGRLSKSFSHFKFFIILLAILIFLNLAYVDWMLFLKPEADMEEKLPFIEKPLQEELDICPQSCISQIYEATASNKLVVTTPIVSQAETKVSARVKEFFIPFGSGSGFENDWQDIEGLQAYIDNQNFEDIKKATFEASVRIPTGNQTAYVRLYNKTDKHPVWFSEVSVTGGTPVLLISEPITLDNGNKLYQVQMKTQLKFLTILDQARIHIITN